MAVTKRARLIVALGVVVTSGLIVQSAPAASLVQLKLAANVAPVPNHNA
jgi:hypothetical protein